MFKSRLSARAFVNKSRLIVGLDMTAKMAGKTGVELKSERDRLEQEAIRIVSATADSAAAFKFNRQLVLPLGLYDGVPRVVDAIHDLGLTAIMDCKINDIGNTNSLIAQHYFDAGFDAVITNPFVGWKEGLEPVFKEAQKRSKGVITLCYMSHPAADEGYGLEVPCDEKKKEHEPLYKVFAKRALMWQADGVIVGATYPEKIREIRRILREDVPIISPGVGAQGGSARDAIEAGASYVIVARSIVNSADPAATAREIAEQTQVT
ncbi:MAG: orotidine 5'-phosphate decarboxylase / HUMPS family protein [Candidatus Thorarchaeota archaeon]